MFHTWHSTETRIGLSLTCDELAPHLRPFLAEFPLDLLDTEHFLAKPTASFAQDPRPRCLVPIEDWIRVRIRSHQPDNRVTTLVPKGNNDRCQEQN